MDTAEPGTSADTEKPTTSSSKKSEIFSVVLK